jgi:hypothetical protein
MLTGRPGTAPGALLALTFYLSDISLWWEA